MIEDIGASTTVGEELYHYGRKGMKWYQHIYGPMQSVAKYAKKAGSKLSEAKASHDERKKAKIEKNKEKIIRSGDAKTIRKNQDKLSDAELKRAFDRLKNTPSEPDQKQKQQGKEFTNKNGSLNARDLVKAFSNFANDIDTTYKAVDKLVSVREDIKKYSPQEKARKAMVDDIIKNGRVTDLMNSYDKFNDKEVERFKNRFNNMNTILNVAEKRGWSMNSGAHSTTSGKHTRREELPRGKHDAPSEKRGKHDKK